MSAVRELTSALLNAGMDPVEAAMLIARAAVEMAPPQDTRSAGAKRQAAYRERNKASLNVTEVTPEKASPNVTNRNETSLSDAASLSIEEKKESRKEKRERAKASQLPNEWRPDPESWSEAVGLLGSSDRAEYELKKFTDHALEKGRLAKNWNAAWRNWAKRAVEFGGRNGHSTLNTQRRSASADFFAGIASVAADIAGNGAASGPTDEEIPLGRFNIDG